MAAPLPKNFDENSPTFYHFGNIVYTFSILLIANWILFDSVVHAFTLWQILLCFQQQNRGEDRKYIVLLFYEHLDKWLW